MKAVFETYVQSIASKYVHEDTSEMGYRTDFEILIRKLFSIMSGSRVGHDSKAKQGNKPDFIVFNKDIPILYIETKDIGVSLDKIENSEQMKRYFGYSNLVLTDYVEFRFYRNGIRYGEPIKVASYNTKNRTLTPLPENYIYLAKAILNFTKSYKEPIKSGKHLSQIMGGKAQRIRNDIRLFTTEELKTETALIKLYKTLKKLLVHDLTLNSFADMYAQTLVYGLFVARYHDKTPGNFSRQEARELIPNSNPFLRHFFDHIVGADFDTRLKYIVDELCEVFSHADVHSLMEEYFKNGKKNTNEKADPVIHFYEDFLQEYDPELRKKMGAYYTPQPVVDFIVKSVDEILKKDFKLVNGIADTTKLPDGKHKVQLLDPATGTGTFISAVINQIHKTIVDTNQEGRWFSYIHNDLLPRVHGFELMMAPYTISHLRLGIEFRKMGFWDFHRRLGIYLTNSLEGDVQQDDLFTAFGLAESIAEESKEANIIKNQIPIMVVLGNPPYSVSSSNKGSWIQNLIKPYKKELEERNIQPLSDDYIKFIRYAEHFIEKNGSGAVAMITNNSYIDGTIHRQMRKHLLNTFENIYILDLHGNAKKKEATLTGEKDENVFNIQQGVAISIFIRTQNKKAGLGTVWHADLYGRRDHKFKTLENKDIRHIEWQSLKYSDPYYFFVPKDFRLEEQYNRGFKIDELFRTYSSGITTFKDNLVIGFTEDDLEKRKEELANTPEGILRSEFSLKDTRDWKLENVITDLGNSSILDIAYRPFDIRKVIYSSKTKGVVSYPRYEVMKNMIRSNTSLLLTKKVTSFDSWQHVFVTNRISERCAVSLQTGEVGYTFPLYLYSNNEERSSNLEKNIIDKINEKVVGATTEDIFNYIYAVLNSPKYRNKYKAFLKIDFPRVPYPESNIDFKKLASLGTKLVELHLLGANSIGKFITSYPISGTDNVDKTPEFKEGRVFINETQYFGNVPQGVWEFYIGGYQPAQKWLKDRKGRTLTNEDIEHYQKMIVAINETIKVMKQIDEVIEL